MEEQNDSPPEEQDQQDQGGTEEQQPSGNEPTLVPSGDEGGDQDPAAASGGRPPANRKERREIWKENQQLKALIATLEAQNAQNRRMVEAVDSMKTSFDATQPKPKDPTLVKLEENRKRLDSAIARLANDPSAYDEYHELQDERTQLNADIAARRAFDEMRQTLPQQETPKSAEYQSLVREYSWLDDKNQRHLRKAANARAEFLAASEKRNMENSQVLLTTLREAAAWVAKTYQLPVAGSAANPKPFASPSGRSGAPASRGASGGYDEADVAEAAVAMYPDLPRPAAIAKWKANVPKLMNAR